MVSLPLKFSTTGAIRTSPHYSECNSSCGWTLYIYVGITCCVSPLAIYQTSSIKAHFTYSITLASYLFLSLLFDSCMHSWKCREFWCDGNFLSPLVVSMIDNAVSLSSRANSYSSNIRLAFIFFFVGS